MESAKAKIDKAVADYIRLFPAEYESFKGWSDKVRAQQRDKFAQTKGTDAIQRKLGEMPERLYYSIVRALTPEEGDWFFTRNAYAKDFRGAYWFYRKYTVFAVTVV